MPVTVPENEYEMSAIRSGGPGGQHVNKVATGIQLRFDIGASSLSEGIKKRLLQFKDKRISKEGIILIKSTQYRSQQRNREEVVRRLLVLIKRASKKEKKRIPTKPTKASKEAKLKEKSRRSEIKKNRGKIIY